jgi:hypothetical protein
MELVERLAAARSAAAVGPLLPRGILRVLGRDARDFLHRMATQDLARLAPGESAYSAFLDAKGHLVGEGLVAARPEDLLLLVEPCELEPLGTHLRRYVVADDVAMVDLSAEMRVLTVLGPLGVVRGRLLAQGEAVVPTPRRGAEAVEIVATPDRAGALRMALVAQGAAELSESDLEVLRIEEGLARFGPDMDRTRLPMEAGLTAQAIHFGKGCYIGQEVVLRASMRGHLQKGLVQLEVPPGAGAGTRLLAGGEEVGWITSACETTRGLFALGYLRRAYWKVGTRLETPAGEAVVTKVVVHELH